MELEKIRQTHAAKENFLRRLAKANLVGRLIVTTSKQSSRTAHCDAGVTQNLPSLPKLTSLTLHGG